MRNLPGLAALLIVTGLTGHALAQTTVAWKLKEGDVFYVKQERDAVQKVDVADSIIRHELKSTNVSRFKVVKAEPDGKLVLEQKIESMSASTGQDNAGIKDMLSRLVGATFTFHLDADFHIQKIEGYEALVKKLGKGDPDLENTVRAVLSEAELRTVVDQLFDFVPRKPVSKDDAWQATTTEPFGALGTLRLKTKWSLEANVTGPDTARLTGKQTATLELGDAAKALAFGVKAGAVRKSDGKLEVVFDVAKGRLQKRTLSRHVQLHYLITQDKRVLDMKIDQDTKLTLEVLDKNPDQK